MGRTRTVTSVKKSCDRLWSLLVRSRGYCEYCGRADGYQLHPHHVYGRRNHTLRFDIRNSCALCAHHHFWAEGNPLDFAEWFKEKRPEDYDYLREKSREITKRSLADYLDLEQQLKEQLENHG